MLSKIDEESLDRRLKNWARYIGDTKRSQSNVIYRYMRLYGDCSDYIVDESETPNPVDNADAELVNRAWQSLPEEPYRYKLAKRVLAHQYCLAGMPLRISMRKLKITNVREYYRLLEMSKYMISCRLGYDQFDKS